MRPTARPTTTLLLALLLGSSGCSTYNYMRDTTPTLEHTRVSYVDTHPTGTFNEKIISGQVTDGMTREEVLVSWGQPDWVRHRTMTPEGEVLDEMWKYREDESSLSRSTFILTFRGDLLDSIEVERGYTPFNTKPDEGAETYELLPRQPVDKTAA
jgi:hypothetical protein